MAEPKKLPEICIHCDRHTLHFLKDRMVEILSREHTEQLHVKPPDAPEVFEFARDKKAAKVFLEICKESYDDYTIRLKGGKPGEIRAVAVAVWKDALLDITDRFRLDINRDVARAKRTEFEKLLGGLAADLINGR